MFADLAKADKEATDMFAVDTGTRDIRVVSPEEARNRDLLTISRQDTEVS